MKIVLVCSHGIHLGEYEIEGDNLPKVVRLGKGWAQRIFVQRTNHYYDEVEPVSVSLPGQGETLTDLTVTRLMGLPDVDRFASLAELKANHLPVYEAVVSKLNEARVATKPPKV